MVRSFALALSVCLTAASATVFADATPSRQAAPRIVEIIAIPDADRIAMLREVLGPHPFASASIRWLAIDRFDRRDVLRSEPEGSGVAVRAWVDLSDPKATFLYFANGSAERFLVRELKLSPGFAANDQEAVGQVLELSIAALLEDPAGGLDRKAAESLLDPAPREPSAHRPVAPPAEGPAAPQAWPPFDFTLFYAVQAFAREIPVVHGPGVSGVVVLRDGPLALSLWASAQYQIASTFEEPGAGVELWGMALRAGVEGALHIGRASAGRALSGGFLGLSIGVGTDVVHVTPLPGTAGAAADLSAPYWSLDPVATAALRVQATLLPRVDLAVSPLADVYLVPAHYDFRSAAVLSTVVAPFAVRPGLLVGLSIH